LSQYQIAETKTFQKALNKNREYQRLYRKIRDYVYPLLRSNPFYGPNIKRLTEPLSDYYRFRIGDYRLFYTVDEAASTVFIVTVRHRKDAYR